MADIEKVLKALQICIPESNQDGLLGCKNCPYNDVCNANDVVGLTLPLIFDIRELLKEQNSQMLALDQSNSANEYLNEEVDNLNVLLRQQQDEIAMLTKKAKSPTWRRGKAFCGSCGGCLENKEKHSADIVSSIRFCKWCGTPVDWSNE